ncbi:hypothetical protein L596_030429 [Steinernema carpocapsae]|uniref:Peptidase S1 domain-containing protein n=1 Tax=Steinernema carpocapsae TaxID=34508 RepID=A0A4U5LPF0_STECR|nr:hypothetical protein L596_030429 [Steinernema carpocapsae]
MSLLLSFQALSISPPPHSPRRSFVTTRALLLSTVKLSLWALDPLPSMTTKPNAFSDNLLETGVVVAKFDYCQRTLPKIATDNDKIVCTVGPHGTHGAGAGESGGPLVAQDGKGVSKLEC